MSQNGHIPEGAKAVTREMLLARNRKRVPAGARLGEDAFYTIRAISPQRYRERLPMLPPEAANWPKDDAGWQAAHFAWLMTLPRETLVSRAQTRADADMQALRDGLVEPKLASLDDVLDLGEEADRLLEAIFVFSGIQKAPEEPVNDAAPTPPTETVPA
jgi:hypothetical protein